MANMDLSLTLKAKDYASNVVKTVESSVSKSTKNIENQAKRSANTQQSAVRQTAQVTEQSYRQIQQAARSREMLGVRSERSIQNEINRTRAAYDQLRRSGIASGRELDRAAVATKRRIAELNAEMGKVSVGQRLGNIGRGIAGVAAGATAAGVVLAQPMKKQMDYDRQLAMTANTAFSERDVKGRIVGKKELNDAVKSAVNIGGGSKEDALGALDTMIASGAISTNTAMKILPTLQKGSTATGANTDDLAKIAISAMQQFNISEDQIGEVLDKAVAAGQAGNFELADMARWLPQQMAAGKSAGLGGMAGFEALLVANQQARVTAGTSDEAGNNLVNLLAKLTSKETNERFKNLKIKGKDGKEHGVDFIASMEAQKSKGKNSIEAFMSIMDQVVGQDSKYQELQKKLKSAKKEDQAAILNQMTNLVEGTAIGQVVSDRQALMALLGIRNNVSLGKEVKESLNKSEGAVDTSYSVIGDTNSAKVEKAKNSVEFAQMEGMKGFNDALGDVSVKIAEYAKSYPDLTGKIVTAGTVVAALSAAAITAAGSLRLLGGKSGLGLGDVLNKGAGVTGAAGGISTAANTAKMGRVAKFGRGGLPLLVFGAMLEGSENYAPYMAQQEEQREVFDAQQKDAKQKFYEAAYPAKSAYQYESPVPKPEKSVWALANGSYALADAKLRKDIADERLRRGTLTQAEYDKRVQVPNYRAEYRDVSNNPKTADNKLKWDITAERLKPTLEFGKPDKHIQQPDYKSEYQHVSSKPKWHIDNKNVVNNTKLKWDITAERLKPTVAFGRPNKHIQQPDHKSEYQHVNSKSKWHIDNKNVVNNTKLKWDITAEKLKRTLTFGGNGDRIKIPDYKAELQQLGTTISEGMKQAVESQNFTIQNQMKVELDGRVIAESTSENQYRELKRG